MKHAFSYIVNFRGGTYCSQVEAESLTASLRSWLVRIKNEKAEIQYLGDKTIAEIADRLKVENYQPVLLNGLKNIWYMHIATKKKALHINIVQTDIS